MNIKKKIEHALKSNVIDEETLQLMLANIGATDPELRDNTIYYGWKNLLENNRLTLNQKENLLNEVIKREWLFYRVDFRDECAVLTRSFTALLLTELLKSHHQAPWITKSRQVQLVDMGLSYLKRETDSRGYDENLGWIHAFAHGADFLGQIFQLENFSPNKAADFLEIIHQALFVIQGFLYGEEGRLARATIELLRNEKISDQNFNQWLQQEQTILEEKNYYNVWWQQYLKSLFLMVQFQDFPFPRSQVSIYDSLQWSFHKYHII